MSFVWRTIAPLRVRLCADGGEGGAFSADLGQSTVRQLQQEEREAILRHSAKAFNLRDCYAICVEYEAASLTTFDFAEDSESLSPFQEAV